MDISDDDAQTQAELGGRQFGADDYEGARRHWQRAFKQFRDAGELRQAVRLAAMLAELHMAGFGNEAASRGWIARGRRLIGKIGRCVELGYLELAVLACSRP